MDTLLDSKKEEVTKLLRSPEAVAHFCFDLASALAHVHKEQLIHRDLACRECWPYAASLTRLFAGNILVGKNGRFVLLDLGLACRSKKKKDTGDVKAADVIVPTLASPWLFEVCLRPVQSC